MKIIEGALDTLQFFFIFLLTVRRIRMFFSLKPSPFQGESSLKISARQGSPFWRSQGTNKQSNRLTDRLALLQSDCRFLLKLAYFHDFVTWSFFVMQITVLHRNDKNIELWGTKQLITGGRKCCMIQRKSHQLYIKEEWILYFTLQSTCPYTCR